MQRLQHHNQPPVSNVINVDDLVDIHMLEEKEMSQNNVLYD